MSKSNHRKSTNILHTKEYYEELQQRPIETLFNLKTPSPGQYDNFKTFFDQGKLRKFTIGKKFAPAKKPKMPGPANYDTRQVLFATRGGSGNHSGQKWSFGTESRGINQEIINRASKIPACTDYSPSCNNGGKNKKIKITFGQKLLDILNDRPMQSPGPAKYLPNQLDM